MASSCALRSEFFGIYERRHTCVLSDVQVIEDIMWEQRRHHLFCFPDQVTHTCSIMRTMRMMLLQFFISPL